MTPCTRSASARPRGSRPVALRLTGHIELPAHVARDGFDHAAIHDGARRCYVAHTANDAVDVIDYECAAFMHSTGGLPGVAGVLVDEARDLAFTSNRGEDTVGRFRPGADKDVITMRVGFAPTASPSIRVVARCWRPTWEIRRSRAPTRCPWSMSTPGGCAAQSPSRAARAGRSMGTSAIATPGRPEGVGPSGRCFPAQAPR
jgi:hypothetical protein